MVWKWETTESLQEKKKHDEKEYRTQADQSNRIWGDGLQGGVKIQLQLCTQKCRQKGGYLGMGLKRLEDDEEGNKNTKICQMKTAQYLITNHKEPRQGLSKTW